jgi:hypothetical protein
MPDVYATIATADEAVQERLAEVLELRAADPQQRAMLETYLEDLAPARGARVLDVGCGTGPWPAPWPRCPRSVRWWASTRRACSSPTPAACRRGSPA